VSTGVLLLVSIAAGFVGAMSGMGGGVVLVPVLTYFGLDVKHAIAISIVSVIATSSGAASAYVKDHLTNLKIGMFLEMFTMLGALVGASITVAANQQTLVLTFAIVLLVSWASLWFQRAHEWEPTPTQDAVSRWLEFEGTYFDLAVGRQIDYRGTRAWLGGPLMFGAGLVAGLLGIGAGALKVVIHDLVMRLPPKVSTTTSNLIIGVTALAGASVYLDAGLIDPGLAAPVILGITIGAFIGTRVLVRLPNRSIRWFFLAMLGALGVEMLIRGIRGG
jgi:uncharacterized membrane protein YfcA